VRSNEASTGMEACEEDPEANGEKRRQIYIEKKDESEKLVACNTAWGQCKRAAGGAREL